MKLSRSALIALALLAPAAAGLAGLAQAAQPNSHRYVTLPPDQSGTTWVLDTTTSLRWQQEPSGLVEGSLSEYCATLGDGARSPEAKELISLLDYSTNPGISPLNAPNGPFSNVQAVWYISANTFGPVNIPWLVNFSRGYVVGNGDHLQLSSLDPSIHVWCVR
jgi:hypothetical protein